MVVDRDNLMLDHNPLKMDELQTSSFTLSYENKEIIKWYHSDVYEPYQAMKQSI